MVVIQTRLIDVREGMMVFDNSGNIVGRVTFIRFGEGNSETHLPDVIIIQEIVTDWLGCATTIPAFLYADIYRDGYIRIEQDLQQVDVIALPNQIAKVGADTLYLEVPLSDLLVC